MTIRQATIQDIDQIIALTYKVHGYTVIDGWMYDKSAIKAYIQDGRIHYLINIDKNHQLNGMVSIFYPEPNNLRYAVIGTLFTEPELRKINSGFIVVKLMERLVGYLEQTAKTSQLTTVICYMATVHQHTQRLISAFKKKCKFVPVGMYIDWAPAWSDKERAHEMAGLNHREHLNFSHDVFFQRRTNMVATKVYSAKRKPYQISLPDCYIAILKKLYSQLDLPVTFCQWRDYDAQTRIECKLDHNRASGLIQVLNTGRDLKALLEQALQHYLEGMLPVIHIALPLNRGNINEAVVALTAKGCQFAALLPSYQGSDTDYLILQYIANIQHKILKEQLYSEECKFIHDVCFATFNKDLV